MFSRHPDGWIMAKGTLQRCERFYSATDPLGIELGQRGAGVLRSAAARRGITKQMTNVIRTCKIDKVQPKGIKDFDQWKL